MKWTIAMLCLITLGLSGCPSGMNGGMQGNDNDNDNGDNGDPASREVQQASWMVIWGNESTFFTSTAFGIGPRMLATNARVSEGIREFFQTEANAAARVVQHETGALRNITTVWSHPDFDANGAPTGSPDVGLLEVDQEIPSRLSLAAASTLASLAVSNQVSRCGFPASAATGIEFPGDLAPGGDFSPAATCTQGTITTLQPFDPVEPATPENTFIIQYDLPVVAGMSGSAVFNAQGEVIGVNALDDDSRFAVRSDKLEELIDLVDSGELTGNELPSGNEQICEASSFCCPDDGFCDVAECIEPDPDCSLCVADQLCIFGCVPPDPDCTGGNEEICQATLFCCTDDFFCDTAECAEPDPDCAFCNQDDFCVFECTPQDPDCQ